MKYFTLTLLATGLHGEPAPLTNIDVGLRYETSAKCEADVKRASGMLDMILANRHGDGVFHVTGHQCKPKERN